ncbi:L-threonine 3-dehydrogenase [Cohnella terricola]|uniref:L-threonine 3-dehydrogenase n=2 Tax=Cohnella terricola TaxID=1289167 RepID=A0A559JST6_9BACL|nr:L-threonine 3-dehydrogenase [Cohnella terricola]TVY02939.1 L-threonine 3-dehydrogenase [Cohnella terricola]
MNGKMIALVKETRGPGAVLRSVDVPDPGSDEVLVRIKTTSICGTDLHIYDWDDWAEKTVVTPNVFGHEFCGIVEVVGERVTNVKVGDYVSAEGHIVCGVCKMCRTGNAHVCPNTKSFGITVPGCFAEYALVKSSNVIHNAPNLPYEFACLQDPLGNAVQTVLSGEIVGKTVLITGVGSIGLMATAVAKACGAGTVLAADVNRYRLDMAGKMGADVLIDSSHCSLQEEVRKHTAGLGAEVVLEMSGHPQAIRDSLDAAANAGRVSLLGIPSKDVSLDLSSQIIFKGLQVHGITGRKMYETWYQVKGLLESGRLDLRGLVTHKLRLEQYEEAFELMRSGQCGKIVFVHDEGGESYGD